MKSDRLRKLAGLTADLAALRDKLRVATWGELADELAPSLKLLDKVADQLHAVGGKLAAPKDERLPLFEADPPRKPVASPEGWKATPISEAILGTKLRKTLADLGVKDAGQAWDFMFEPAAKALSKGEIDAIRAYCLDLEFGTDEELAKAAEAEQELPPLPSWRTTPVEAIDADRTTVDYMLEAEIVDAGEAWDLLERGDLVEKLGFTVAEAKEIEGALVKLRAEAGDPAPMTGPMEEAEAEVEPDEEPWDIEKGAIVRTNYSTGPYRVVRVSGFEVAHCQGCNAEHRNPDGLKVYSLTMVDWRDYPGKPSTPTFHLNDYRKVGGKYLKYYPECPKIGPKHRTNPPDELFIMDPGELETIATEPPKKYIDVSNLPKPKREKKPKAIDVQSRAIDPVPSSEVLAGSTTTDPYPPGTLMFACNRCNARRSSVDCKPPHPCPSCGSPEFRSYFVPQPDGLRTYEVVEKVGQAAPGHIQFGAIDDADAARKVALDWPKLTFREITDPSRMVGNQVGSLGQPKSPQPWQEAPKVAPVGPMAIENFDDVRARAAIEAKNSPAWSSPSKPLKAWDVRDHKGNVLGQVESTSLGGARNKANRRWAKRPESDKSLKVSEAASLAY